MRTYDEITTINAKPNSYANVNYLPYYAVYYIMAYNTLIKQMEGLYRHDIAILVHLHDHKSPLSWTYILGLINSSQTMLNYHAFSEAIERLVSKGYIHKQRQSKFIHYTITDTGKAFLYSFAANLDYLVKERLLKFAPNE